jgi:hypothetical protein
LLDLPFFWDLKQWEVEREYTALDSFCQEIERNILGAIFGHYFGEYRANNARLMAVDQTGWQGERVHDGRRTGITHQILHRNLPKLE